LNIALLSFEVCKNNFYTARKYGYEVFKVFHTEPGAFYNNVLQIYQYHRQVFSTLSILSKISCWF